MIKTVQDGQKRRQKKENDYEKKIFAAIAAALTLSLSAGSAVMAEASLDTENPIKIGYIGALSGDTALWGQAGLNGMERLQNRSTKQAVF